MIANFSSLLKSELFVQKICSRVSSYLLESKTAILIGLVWFGLVWFLCLMAYQFFLGYLMPKPFSKKNSSATI